MPPCEAHVPSLKGMLHFCETQVQFNPKKLQILFTRSRLHKSLKLGNLVTRHTIRLVDLVGKKLDGRQQSRLIDQDTHSFCPV